MKVCNLGTVTHLEDIMQMSDYICTEAPLLIIVPAFDQIKRSLQEISIHLFRAEQEKASQAILHLEKHCMETQAVQSRRTVQQYSTCTRGFFIHQSWTGFVEPEGTG